MVEYNKFKKKEYIKQDGRRLATGGPRDSQIRLQQQVVESGVINSLQLQVTELKNKLHDHDGGSCVGEIISTSEIDDEINKAVADAIIATEKKSYKKIKSLDEELGVVSSTFEAKLKDTKGLISKFEEQIKLLENNVTSLRIVIGAKDQTIGVLKSQLDSMCDVNDVSHETIEEVLENVEPIEESNFVDTDRPQMKTTFIDPLDKKAADRLEPHINIEDDNEKPKNDKISDRVAKLKKILGKE